MKRGLILVSVLCLLAGLGPGEEAKKEATTFTRTYPLQTSDVGLTLEVIRQVIGEKPSVIHYKPENQLIITATADEHRQVAAVLAEINVPSPNVRLDVQTTLVGSSSDTHIGTKGGSGDVQVTREGTKVRYKFRPEAHARSGGVSSMTRQTLVVQSGKEASLMVGQEVPFFEYIVGWGKQWGLIDRELLRERTGAFLVAKPQVIGAGPMINVTLVPEIRELVGEKRQRIRFTRVETTVTVKDGETIALGGLGESQAFFDRFLVGIDENGTRRSMSITLTPRLIKPDGTPANSSKPPP